MKILHVIPGLSPLYGGPTKAVIEMCRELKNRGVEAEIATTDADVRGNIRIPLAQPVEIEGVTVYCFRSPFLRKYGFSWGLTQWLKEHVRNYQLLHIHAFFSYVTAPTAYYAKKSEIPYIIRPSGELNPWPLRKSPIKKSLYLSLFGKQCLNNASALHLTSEDERKAAQRLSSRAKTVVIPLGLHPLVENGFPRKRDFVKKYPMLAQKKLIVFLSRIDPKKGLDQLIPAVAYLAHQRNDFAVVIAGSGSGTYETAIHRFAVSEGLGDNIVFTGFLQGQEKSGLLRDADIFVLPSYDENFGLAVVEALAMGVPVVISKQVGIHHEVTQYGAGIVTECHAGIIADALKRLLDNEPLRIKMGENGRRLVREKFTWEKVSKELMELYESIVSEGKHDSAAT